MPTPPISEQWYAAGFSMPETVNDAVLHWVNCSPAAVEYVRDNRPISLAYDAARVALFELAKTYPEIALLLLQSDDVTAYAAACNVDVHSMRRTLATDADAPRQFAAWKQTRSK